MSNNELYIDHEVRIRLSEESNKDIKIELKSIHQEIKNEMKSIRQDMHSQFKWTIGIFIGLFCGTFIPLFTGILLHAAKLV